MSQDKKDTDTTTTTTTTTPTTGTGSRKGDTDPTASPTGSRKG